MVYYEYFDNNSFIIFRFIGEIDKNEIISFMKFVYRNTDSHNLKKILCDLRSADIIIGEEDLKEIAQRRTNYSKGFPDTRSVFLVGHPYETALTLLVANYYRDEIKDVNVCSTIEYCIYELRLNTSIQELNFRIENLKNLFSIENK